MRFKSVALVAAAATVVAAPLAVMAAAAAGGRAPAAAAKPGAKAAGAAAKPASSAGGKLMSGLNKPFPGKVGKEVAFPPVHTPAQELATFTMPPGYQVQLVASEPLVTDPIKAEYDNDGRLWVLEEKGWGINDHSDNSRDPVNDVAILEDTNNDGVFDKKTIFLDKLVLPRALKVLDKGCALVGAPPNIIHACDTNGDLQADTRDIISNQFATNLANSTGMEHGGNGLFWGMDNMLRLSEQANDVTYKDGKFTVIPGLSRGQWGITQDNGGRIYRNVNTDALFVDYLPAQYFLRNPNMVRTNGLYQTLVADPDKTRIWPLSPQRGFNRGYRDDYFRKDNTALYYQGVSSPFIYRGTSLPKDIQNQAFVVDGPTNIVHLLKIADNNGRPTATDFYKQGEFLASTEERFRPVEMVPSWDGSFLIVDMYRGVSQDGPVQTDYIRGYIAKKKLTEGIHTGRIYKVTYVGMKPDNPKPAMNSETPAQLVAHLSNANGWWRDKAQEALVERGDKSVVPALRTLAGSAPQAYTRLQALWTLDGLGAVEPADVTKALGDSSADVRTAAIRLSEHWIATDAAMQQAVLAKIGDPNWYVRTQLAGTLGYLPAAQRTAPLTDMLTRYGDDTILTDSAISSLSGQESAVLQTLLSQPAAKADAISMLTAAVTKGRNPATIQNLIAQATDNSRPVAIRVALMDGLAGGIAGQVDNGPQASLGGATVPGMEGGGGGGGRGGRGGGAVTLASSPTALLALANGNGAEAKSAKSIIDAVTWPGKPPPPAVTPLTAAEQARYNAGQTIFQQRCIGCHGPEGQGIAKEGAKLAGSPLVAAGPDVMIHILLNGKEGSIGLMPPLGQTLNDDELAAVITYVKRSFGNTAAPVQPAQVRETRALNVDRKTPWTDAELLAGGRGGGGRGGGGGGAAAAGGGRGGAVGGAGAAGGRGG